MKKIAMFLLSLLAVMLMGCDEDLCMKVHHSDVIPGLYGGYIGCRYVLNDGSDVVYYGEYYAVKCTDSYVIKDSTRVRDRWSSDGWRWLRWQGTYQTLEHCLDGVADYRQRVKEIEKKDEEAVKRYEETAKKYEIVTIGEQVWMSKNLNVKTVGSWCYDNKPENCEKYGRLYTWAAAMNFSSSCNEVRCQDLVEYPHQGICPSGFHIPTESEWEDLFRADKSLQEIVAGTKLKSSSGWGGGG
ncbi:FISUMP domain-containing protein [Fibrobacter sp. UWH1]|uniref:FISUMP domain-containing protein n=1 Tax=Fibrobacter sp. UWH1 TaxID=1964354 RepID=UPI000B5267A7|nr:FISUMP domain-containing protein [Fibrobacter sp. UWH1]OWV06233.1 hypothetical protein B7992_15055 [Fibrobacter sp. UWH1]